MSRRFNQTYRSTHLDELARQLIRSPPDKRADQVRRAEQLHDTLDPDATYPMDFLAYRLTGYRPASPDPTLLVGQAIAADLRLIIDSLSRSFDMPPAPDESFESPGQLATRLAVSTKTLERWRHDGLRWRWVFDNDADRRRVQFERSAVDRFITAHPQRVGRAATFTQTPDRLRARLLTRARRIADGRDISLYRVARHLARRTDRSHEAIRQILLKHDQDNPHAPIFAGHTGPLTGRQRRVIARAAGRGVAIADLARRFGKTPTTIRRAVQRVRLETALRRDLTHHASPLFDRPDADAVILHSDPARHALARAPEVFPRASQTPPPPPPEVFPRASQTPPPPPPEVFPRASQTPPPPPPEVFPRASQTPPPPSPEVFPPQVPPPEGSLPNVPSLPVPSPQAAPQRPPPPPAAVMDLYVQEKISPQNQRQLFLRFNYLRHKALRLRDQIRPSDPRRGELDRFDAWIQQIDQLRSRLARANLPLVLSVARRHRARTPGTAPTSPDTDRELLETGNRVLFKAIEAYDPTHGPDFTSFVTNRLLRRFATLDIPTTAQTPARARRRDQDQQVLRRMLDQAQATGLDLLPPPPGSSPRNLPPHAPEQPASNR